MKPDTKTWFCIKCSDPLIGTRSNTYCNVCMSTDLVTGMSQNDLWERANHLYSIRQHTQDGRNDQMKEFMLVPRADNMLYLSDNKILEEVVVDLKSATPNQRRQIGEIFLSNYALLVNAMVTEGDYGRTTSYWKGHTPMAHNIIDPQEFIEKYSNPKKP